jgi:hypothetical protein
LDCARYGKEYVEERVGEGKGRKDRRGTSQRDELVVYVIAIQRQKYVAERRNSTAFARSLANPQWKIL